MLPVCWMVFTRVIKLHVAIHFLVAFSVVVPVFITTTLIVRPVVPGIVLIVFPSNFVQKVIVHGVLADVNLHHHHVAPIVRLALLVLLAPKQTVHGIVAAGHVDSRIVMMTMMMMTILKGSFGF